jgi:hypothetical protein
MKQEILDVLEKSFAVNMQKHAMNIRIMLDNPMAIHEHTDFMGAIELELAQIAEYQDKIEALKYVGNHD